ncbi:RE1, partial [Symbiodinium microadriaticum]
EDDGDGGAGTGTGGGERQLEALLKGMTQLQAAMTMQLGLQAARPETIRPGTSGSELPKLVEADEYAAINVGDWLHGLSGPMGDLTDGSSSWWAETMRCLDNFYQTFVTSSAVKKLNLKAEDYMSEVLREPKWHRVDKRAASMLLQAVPEAIKAELLANRLGTTLGILGRIVTIYRPGSAAERQQVLKALESPGHGSSPVEVVEVLRKWARWLKRAQDLSLQVPDASILLRGLDTAVKAQLAQNYEINFRTNMLRFSLDLDTAPTLSTVSRFHSHLLGEFEQLAYRGRGKGTSGVTPVVKNVAATNQDGGGTPKGGASPQQPAGKPCKFFLSETGCKRANCKYAHDWMAIPKEERMERCKACGGKGHMKRNCPVKDGNTDGPRRGDEGKGGQPPKVRSANTGGQKGGEGKRDDGTMPGSTTSSTPASSSLGGSMDSNQGGGGGSASTAPMAAKEMDDFLKNATQVLKLMTDQQAGLGAINPTMKMLKTVVADYERKMALVDSGATHPLRRATESEWVESPEVDVVVAGDSTARMKQTGAGTLLTNPRPSTSSTQAILPVGSLVSVLGYELRWNRKRCLLRAPDGKEIPLRVASGCPELDEAKALRLIAEIEQENVNRLQQQVETTRIAMVRACMIQGDEQWERSLKQYVQHGVFEDGFRSMVSAPWAKEVPREALVKVIMDLPKTNDEAWKLMCELGFNRRMRKRLVHKDWIVKLFSGPRSPMDKTFKAVESGSSLVLDIDVQRLSTLDLRSQGDGIMKLLLWGSVTGRVAAVVGGLPKANTEDLLLRSVVLVEVAKAGRAAMCEAADVPMDGVAVSLWASSEAEEDETAAVWRTQWFRRWLEEQPLLVHHFEQGGLGHAARRPTTMATNLDVSELRGVTDQRRDPPELTVQWATWAPMMSRTIVQGIKRWKQRPGWYPRLMRALKAVDRRSWERHLANDHVPYHPDCLQCIHNATGRPHRKCLHRDCYVLSADVLGPVRVPGPKGERHAIVFTYQFPRQRLAPQDQPIAEEELVGWNLDVKGTQPEVPEGEEYSPDEGEDAELLPEELEELRRVQAEVVELPEEAMVGVRKLKKGKDSEPKEDWWEFREASGVLVRHHVASRAALFRPTSWNGCPVHPARLEPTRITEIQYDGGGVDMETSDWHGPQSGARKLGRTWTGRSTFHISTAEEVEEEELLKKDEDDWEKLIGDLTQPMELDTIYMVCPVRARRGGDAMLAIQEAVLRLKLWGYPVARLHTDRGSEFASKGLRKWLLDHDIYHTRSEALVPQTNGAAERGVRWFKTRAKVLLDEAKVPLKYWTLAMQHAAHRRIYDRLGLSKPELLKFGAEVFIRRKVFGNNKKYDLTDRWEKGVYLGLSDTIKGGAVVLRPSGILTETKNLNHLLLAENPKENGDDGGGVGAIEVERRLILDLPEPDHRLREKQQPPEIRRLGPELPPRQQGGWTMRSLLKQQEEKAKYFYENARFDDESCAELLDAVDVRGKMRTGTRGTKTSSMVLGAYVHGGLRGITLAAGKRMWLTKYLNAMLKLRASTDIPGDVAWTTLGVFKAKDIPPHRDLRNQPGSLNYATEVGNRDAGGFWVARSDGAIGCQGGGKSLEHVRELPDGSKVQGDLVKISGRVVAFNPRTVHSYVDKAAERWIVAGFTPLGVDKLKPETVVQLKRAGFPLRSSSVPMDGVDEDEEELSSGISDEETSESGEEEIDHQARVLRCCLESQEYLRRDREHQDEYSLYLEAMLEEFAEDIKHQERTKIRKIMKVSPGAAVDVEVEQLLQELQAPLEVVHNVSLPEVKKHLPRWRAAIQKEVKALIDSGTIKRIGPQEARELRAKGMVVLPGKGVFTVKPPVDTKEGDATMYRRKCRLVVCGNYLPQNNSDVYASGTSADSFRIAVAYAVYRRWSAGGTDISNAFTLAPMPGDMLYALQPPTVAVMAEEAMPGELWLIQRVLYGLREAPRLWGLFRNNRFHNARVPHEGGFLVMVNMETDENVWMVKGENEEEVKGVVLIYVDDILFLSSPSIIQSLYDWLVSAWKCTALEKIEDGFIRFLGMELRLWQDGLHISQAGYVRDLLRQHGVDESDKGLTVPCAREWLQDEDTDEAPTAADEMLVKMAQKATGETLWLSTRSRPELAHSVACMAARALNKPQRALEIHKRMMQYLARTADYGMYYYHDKSEPLLAVFSDASFAPGGGRSFGCIMAQLAGMPVAWRASKQPVITLSVAEAELYEGVAAVQLGLGVETMLRELGETPVMVLKIDNQAAQGLASQAPGSWKTRHLRIRARFLRQEVNEQRLLITHVPGDLQKADIGTKAFDLPKFRSLMALWGMVPWKGGDAAATTVKMMSVVNNKRPLVFILVCLMILKTAGATKEDLPLDGSLEFYAMVMIAAVAAVAIWELLKRAGNIVAKWCAAARRKRERLESYFMEDLYELDVAEVECAHYLHSDGTRGRGGVQIR